MKITRLLIAMWNEEDGQDLVEYSLLLGTLALGSIALLSSGGHSVKSVWTMINTSLTSAKNAAS